MIAIGDVKWGNRIEPINIHELSREELELILEEHDIRLEAKDSYPIDSRLVSVFRADTQKLSEYIRACKYAHDKKNGQHAKKNDIKELSIFGDDLKINYELKHLKEATIIDEEEKTEIYKNAKSTQSLFRMFGSNNVRLEINLLDRVYFEVQNFIQTAKARKKIKALPEGTRQPENEKSKIPDVESTYRKTLFNKDAQQATSKVSEQWKELQTPNNEKKEREII